MSGFADIFFAAPDGLRLHALDYDGATTAKIPVLCLAGLTRNVRDFAGLADRLAPARRVIVAEQRGRGQSAYDPEPQNYQPLTYVQDMMALLDHLAIPKVAIVGTSLGGLMAMLMAAGWPERIAGIFLNDVGPEVAPEGIALIRTYIDRVSRATNWEDAAREVETLYGSSYPTFTAADWRKMARALYRTSPSGAPVLDYDPAIAVAVKGGGSAAPDLWSIWDKVPPMPIAVLRGALSNILAPATFVEMQRRRPDVMAAEIAEVGHVPLLDEPPALALLQRFFAAVDQTL